MIESPSAPISPPPKAQLTITEALDERQIYRIDHYLGKEMIRNILAIRFGNSLFEPLWNHHYIDNIQITSTETLGVEGRGGYYERSGILKDMLQNHLLQMLALITMEPPADLMPESIRDEKVKAPRPAQVCPSGACEGIARAVRPRRQWQAGARIPRGTDVEISGILTFALRAWDIAGQVPIDIRA